MAFSDKPPLEGLANAANFDMLEGYEAPWGAGEIMIDKGLLKVLVCPKDHSPLTLADSRLTGRVNRAISAGRVINCGGRTLAQPIDGGLVRQDKTLLYPIVDGIPVLLAEEAILLDKLS